MIDWHIDINTIVNVIAFAGGYAGLILTMRSNIVQAQNDIKEIRSTLSNISDLLIQVSRQDERLKNLEAYQNERLRRERRTP